MAEKDHDRNKNTEEMVAELRCENKSVKQIMKTLSLRKEEIEKMIKNWIIETDPFIEKMVKGRKVSSSPDVNKISQLIKQDIREILDDPLALDYIAKKRSDHHDRFMDCIRFKIKQYLEKGSK
ncbi:hypothetical protein DMB44_01910 [Thermoplasma sp. Kam2015]|uniref:hypothetical protein n=1 Tax=Thermoplasma sp. Kam2015 TaxID=2094122 RepID=UPI000D908EFB|nr:hypothetical protein [Thermoplasma sp. Kam2015]PYB68842.1 hypothetical protein DMB44_01910 [Thermoplasma sp. Kam2015]